MSAVGRRGATAPDLTRVRPYGDTLDDGQVQLSFSLPVPFGEEASEAARQLCRTMGLADPRVYHAKDLGQGYTFFIVYARTAAAVDFTRITVARVDGARMAKGEIERYVAEHIRRPVWCWARRREPTRTRWASMLS
jgi:beta-lysine 5,6-aminomutase beta subunit